MKYLTKAKERELTEKILLKARPLDKKELKLVKEGISLALNYVIPN